MRLPGGSQTQRLLELALAEDLPAGDVTSDAVVPSDATGEARFVARRPAVLAGTAAACCVFELVDRGVKIEFSATDGSALDAGQVFGRASGSLRSLLAGERTALNLLQRLSGIAAHARELVARVAATGVVIVDTRKTTPGLRALEKAAVRAGGAANHRSSLSDGVLIKTNHVRVAGSVAAAVERARARAPHTLRIEVEVRDIPELEEAIAAGAEICLLDNMGVDAMAEAVRVAGGACLLEASGGIDRDNVSAVAATGVDRISIGALTHSSPAADLAFEIVEE